MKHKILLLIGMITLTTYAQEFKLGFKGGANIANTWIEYKDIKTDSRLSGHIGALLDIGFSSRIHLQIETQYSREGNKDGYIDYINTPVLLKIYPVKNRFYLSTGPQLGFLTSVEGGDYGIKKTNVVFNFGLGYESKSGFLIDFRYGTGLTGIVNENIIVQGPWDEIHLGKVKILTQLWQLGIGYKFDL